MVSLRRHFHEIHTADWTQVIRLVPYDLWVHGAHPKLFRRGNGSLVGGRAWTRARLHRMGHMIMVNLPARRIVSIEIPGRPESYGRSSSKPDSCVSEHKTLPPFEIPCFIRRCHLYTQPAIEAGHAVTKNDYPCATLLRSSPGFLIICLDQVRRLAAIFTLLASRHTRLSFSCSRGSGCRRRLSFLPRHCMYQCQSTYRKPRTFPL